MLKILHTADWHLGQRLYNRSRHQEHKAALDFLVKHIIDESIDIVIIAGDVFDVVNPPNEARELYFDFLRQMVNRVQAVVVIAGNHDSPSMLQASADLLKMLNIHVIARMPTEANKAVIPISNPSGDLLAVVAAVPFLRDRDIRVSVSGAQAADRNASIQEGIRSVYDRIAVACQSFSQIPIIATGHLAASQAINPSEQSNIYAGNLTNIDAKDFPDVFDYVALGHIHKPQAMSKSRNVYYAGSLIPLHVNEGKSPRCFQRIDFDSNCLASIQAIDIPTTRFVKQIQCAPQELESCIQELPQAELPTWIEILLDTYDPSLLRLERYEELAATHSVEILRLRSIATRKGDDWLAQQVEAETTLDQLEVRDVFEQMLQSKHITKERIKTLVATFDELQEWMQQEDHENIVP